MFCIKNPENSHIYILYKNARTRQPIKNMFWRIETFFMEVWHVCVNKFCGGKNNEIYSRTISCDATLLDKRKQLWT